MFTAPTSDSLPHQNFEVNCQTFSFLPHPFAELRNLKRKLLLASQELRGQDDAVVKELADCSARERPAVRRMDVYNQLGAELTFPANGDPPARIKPNGKGDNTRAVPFSKGESFLNHGHQGLRAGPALNPTLTAPNQIPSWTQPGQK